jgi:hypothetical protein
MALIQSSASTERGYPSSVPVKKREPSRRAELRVTACTRSIRSRIPTWRHHPRNSPNTPNAAKRPASTNGRVFQYIPSISFGTPRSKRRPKANRYATGMSSRCSAKISGRRNRMRIVGSIQPKP